MQFYRLIKNLFFRTILAYMIEIAFRIYNKKYTRKHKLKYIIDQ